MYWAPPVQRRRLRRPPTSGDRPASRGGLRSGLLSVFETGCGVSEQVSGVCEAGVGLPKWWRAGTPRGDSRSQCAAGG